MAAKRTSEKRTRRPTPGLGRTVRDSAQQIWLAGLGALAKTQEEGGKVFDALVEEGRSLESRTRGFAQSRMGPAGEQLGQATSQATMRALQTWGWLEKAFEDGLARTLKRVGAPTQSDFADLIQRLDALERKSRSPRATTAQRKPASKTSAKKSAGRSARAR
ncbi:MAG TPA: phasin family protein [Burkholderiales bacterium]|nr:phasin family protein [Burkholderiales bacterium]